MTDTGQSTENLSVGLGIALILLGVAAYAISDFASVTALIPAVFGILVVGLGLLGRDEQYRRIALYAIGALAILGVLGSLRVVPDVIAQEWTVGTISQGIMIVLSLTLLGIVARDVLDLG